MSTEFAAPPPLFDEEHDAFRESVATFLRREVVPVYEQWRRAGGVPRDLLRAAAAHGFLGMRVPERHGGAGVDDPRFGVVVAEEAMAAGATDLALVLAMHNDVALPALLRALPDERRSALLPGLASGDLLATVASGDVRITDGATLDGRVPSDSGATVHGRASFVVSGRDADVFVVRGGDGSLAVVERGASGLIAGPSEAPVGLHAAGLADVTFEAVPALVLDGAEQLAIDRDLALAVTALAGARAALATTVAYVVDRKAFGQPIAAFENTRHVLAAVQAELWAAETFLERALRAHLAGRLDAARVAAVNLRCSELYDRAVDTGVQLHGGYGYILEYPIAHALADARLWTLLAGDPSDAIARAVLP